MTGTRLPPFVSAALAALMLGACAGSTSPGRFIGKPVGAPVVEIAVGRQHSCARRADGSVWCWGDNSSGQLGTGDKRSYLVPARVLGINDAQHIALGDDFSCARLSGSTVWCWGANGSGQIGGGPGPQQLLAEAVPRLANVVRIAAGGYHLCAALRDGSVQCRGGHVPNSPREGYAVDWCENRDCETNVQEVARPVQINGFAHRFCTLLPDGAVRCFHFDPAGVTQHPVIEPALDFVGAVSVAADGRGGCAVLEGGSVRCWQAGSSRSAVIAELPAATSVALGSEHACALLADGAVQCWGNNEFGQLGRGYPASHQDAAPKRVHELTDVAQIAAGQYHTCALRHDGSVWCWGSNDGGQLGTGRLKNSFGERFFDVPLPVTW